MKQKPKIWYNMTETEFVSELKAQCRDTAFRRILEEMDNLTYEQHITLFHVLTLKLNGS